MSMEEYKDYQYKAIIDCSNFGDCPEFILKRNMHIIYSLIVGFFLGIGILFLLVQFNALNLSAKHYVYVDVDKVINEVNDKLFEQIKTNKIDDKKVEEKLLKAKNQFNNLLKQYAIEHNAIVFSTNKVIAGAENVTEYFITNLKEIK